MKVIKVMPWSEDQGDHVLIEEQDFNPEFHKPFKEGAHKSEPAKRGRPSKSNDAQETE